MHLTGPTDCLVSVIINNYNYARYLSSAIASALAQTHSPTEVIVVDDGSSDHSREVIASYGSELKPVLKENGGQGSAFNAGFRESHGQIVIFLDADDVLLPTAAAEAVAALAVSGAAKAHWPLIEINEDGDPTGKCGPAPLPEGDLSHEMIESGPGRAVFGSPPTSGNAWARSMLEEALPMPEDLYRGGADSYLLTLAPLLGSVRVIPQPQGYYRRHSQNLHATMPFAVKLSRDLALFSDSCRLIAEAARAKGILVDRERWMRESWVGRVAAVVSAIAANIPPGEPFLLADVGQIGMPEVDGRPAIAFPAAGGAPPDDNSAITELRRRRRDGIQHFVITFPAFWWLDYYEVLSKWLTQFDVSHEDENLILIELAR